MIHPIMSELRHLRVKRRISQRSVAYALGVTPPAISHWENGKRNLTLSQLQAYARALGARIRIEVQAPAEPTEEASNGA